MKDFLKYLLATIIGIILASFIMFLIFMGIVSVMISMQNKPAEIRDNSVLMLTLDKPVLDRIPSIPFSSSRYLGLNDILKNIEKAKEDSKIKGIYIEPLIIPAGIATIDEIRNAILDFKESGKFVICYGDYFSQTSYYLATAADKIYMNPEGFFPLVGMRAQILFFKGAFEKLGIKPEIVRHGEYKSAVEPLMYDQMSDENREQINALLVSIWDYITSQISDSRGITKEQINNMADNLLIWDAKATVQHNLIDSLVHKDFILDELMELSGIEKSKKPRLVPLSKYNRVPAIRKHKGLAKNKVAVIYASGVIGFGGEDESQISAEKISKAIRDARKDTAIKAIVLRITSGGGNNIASEVIWKELDLARKVKPVIASFGDVAASGGYYIAVPADTIIAGKNTITGSIGIWGVFINIKEFLNKKLGITMDIEKTNKYSDFISGYRPISAKEREILQKHVDEIYDTFVAHVSEGRDMTYEQVDKIGDGRVWSGIDAKEIGLIDLHGGLTAAIDIAVKRTKLDKYRIVELPKPEDPIQQLIKELTGEISTVLIRKEIGQHYKYYKFLKEAVNIGGVQARMPFEIEIY
jgi:protease-4